ncbi:AAA family ATPase [Ureaplasma parvum]|nr:AAA family ATPase [Ureaplasma parvum]
MCKKITFVNNKGGVGKTTLTTNYGVVLAKKRL